MGHKSFVGEFDYLFGTYGTHGSASGHGQDVYWLGRTSDLKELNGTMGEEARHTLGGRAWGSLSTGIDYEAELAVQLGDLGQAAIFAGMAGLELGYRPADSPVRFRAGAEFGSGDSTPGGDSHTLIVKGRLTEHAAWEAGYGHFFAGSAFTDAGFTEDPDFGYVQLSYAF